MAESAIHGLSRSACFPPSFVFGVATSSVQIEGGTSEGGRGPGIWDTFANVPGKITDGSTPAVACDHFHRFREDILEMKTLGVEAYRFSFSWPRLFPDNSGKLNEKGVAFYNAIIDCVVEAGLTPCVTLYHWDLPQFLEDDPEVKGWRTKNIVKHFAVFANACFNCFGDRIKHWITFNETYMVAILAHGHGFYAPGRISNKSTEPYLVAHHQLLAHAAAVKIYRADFQEKQKGVIGVAALMRWAEPFTKAQEDKDAAERWQQFQCAWLLDPIQFGDYPQIMRELVGDRLPRFSPEEIEELKGSVDFIGVNYYTASWAMNAKEYVSEDERWWANDSQADTFWRAADGKLIGELMASATFRLLSSFTKYALDLKFFELPFARRRLN